MQVTNQSCTPAPAPAGDWSRREHRSTRSWISRILPCSALRACSILRLLTCVRSVCTYVSMHACTCVCIHAYMCECIYAVCKASSISTETVPKTSSILIENVRKTSSILIENVRKGSSILIENVRKGSSILIENVRKGSSILTLFSYMRASVAVASPYTSMHHKHTTSTMQRLPWCLLQRSLP